MLTLSDSRLVKLAERSYRLLLLTYPAEFRRAYASEMVQTFRAACHDALRTEGWQGFARFCGLALHDLMTTTVREHGQAWFLRLKRLISGPVLLLSPTGLESVLGITSLRLQIAQQTDIGCTRSLNEDRLITILPEDPHMLQNKGALLVVADGMGGHQMGERASELAVDTVREVYYQDQQAESAEALSRAIQQANALIWAENIAHGPIDDEKFPMGTTCIAAVLREKNLIVANVGDSRLYVVHAGQLRQVSQDHSVVARMVLAGEITSAEARHHIKRNQLYRALGVEAEVEVDVFTEVVEEGDAVILCTDGLCGLVEDEEILRIVEAYEPQESVRHLIASANAAGGPDNITAIVVRVD